MPENEFEKQVKELMEELHFSPSAPVWEKIRKRISEKKRRVWPIFFLFISLAVVSSYFFYTNIHHADKNITNNPVKHNTPETKNLPLDTSAENTTTKNDSLKQSQELLSFKKINKTKSVTAANISKKNKPVLNRPSIKKNNAQEIIDTSDYKHSYAKTQEFQPGNSINNINNNDNINENNINTPGQQPAEKNILENSVADNNNHTDSLIKVNQDTEKNNSTAQKKTPAKKIIRTHKWQWGVSAMYGRSTINDKFLDVSNEKSVPTNTVNPGALYGYPAAVKNPYNTNTAYSFGITVQRKILKQSSLNTGVNFVHLSATSNTALRLDSTLALLANDVQSSYFAPSFYRAGTAKTYTSNFSFIEIPVTFQSNIFHTHNFSVLYDAGVSVMQLISSDALVYDNHRNSFFASNDLFRRTQVQLKAGLNFQLKMKNNSILLGPNFTYSLSPYLKNNNYEQLHFINYGLKASWLFNKR